MKTITKISALLIAMLMLTGCIFNPVRCVSSLVQDIVSISEQVIPTPDIDMPTDEPQPTAPEPAETKEAEQTEQSKASPTTEATPEPTAMPEPIYTTPDEAEEAFRTLDDELFTWYVTTDITTLDQFCAYPEDFGIDEASVPVTLGDFSEAANDEWVESCIGWRARLCEIDRSALSEHTAFAYDTYCRFFDGEIESKDWFFNYEPLDEYVGLHMNLPLVFGLYMFKDVKDVENYLTLMADVPRYMGQVLAFEQERADRGLFMTEDMLDQILSDLKTVAESGETSYLHGTFREEMEKADFLTAAQKESFIAQNDELVRTKWVEGYQLLYDGLEKLRSKCRKPVGAYEQGGSAYDYFCWKLRYEAAGNRTVEDEIKLLEDCISQMYDELLQCARSCYSDLISGKKLTTGSLESDEAYLKSLMPKIVPAMPDVEVKYLEIPKELQDSFSPAAYLTPALDDYRHNIILTNPKDQEHYDMSTLAHEGFPGHMYQFTYQYALGTIPKFQLVIESNGYAESWSTNSELNIARINEQFGADLATATFLNDYITNLIVMVCSLKVNGQGATKLMLEKYLNKWGMSDAADQLYDVSINMPIYYFKYAGGFSELFALTERCKKAVRNFDSVAFYREYLSWGPGYFDLLNERMTAWANAQ